MFRFRLLKSLLGSVVLLVCKRCTISLFIDLLWSSKQIVYLSVDSYTKLFSSPSVVMWNVLAEQPHFEPVYLCIQFLRNLSFPSVISKCRRYVTLFYRNTSVKFFCHLVSLTFFHKIDVYHWYSFLGVSLKIGFNSCTIFR